MPILSKYAPKEIFIDPASYFADSINSDIVNSGLAKTDDSANTEEFYVSSSPEKFKNSAKMFYNIESEIQEIKF